MASTFSDASSQGSPHPELMILGLLLVSTCLLVCGFGMAHTLPRYARVVQVSLTLSSLGILMTALCRDYNRSPGIPRNREGWLHNAFSIVAVFAILVTILAICLAVRHQPAWDHLALPGMAILVIVALAGLAFTWGPDSHDGLAERVLAGLAFFYLSWVSLTAHAVVRGVPLREFLKPNYLPGETAAAPVVIDD